MLVVLVGQPNSGKSALLALLTGARVMTSNYPGTTVELVSGTIKAQGAGGRANPKPRGRPSMGPDTGADERLSETTVLDTPGIYSLAASTKEQEVTRDVLEHRNPDLVINVLDATNLARHLSLTLSLLDYGLPTALALNSCDRLASMGLSVDTEALSARLGIPVILTSAMTGEGISKLKELIVASSRKPTGPGLSGLAKPLRTSSPPAIFSSSDLTLPDTTGTRFRQGPSVSEPDLRRYQEEASRIAREVVCTRTVSQPGSASAGYQWREKFEDSLDHPVVSLPVLGLALMLGWKAIAWALPFAETTVRAVLAPVTEVLGRLLNATLPRGSIGEALTEAIPEGVVLPVATVLPAMIVAYTLIALLEDSGFLSRYAALGDTLTRTLNLPGQALIPFMLAFGCRVPALLSARILPSPQSRRAASVIITTVVPCTATVSLSLATLARFRASPLVPAAAVVASMLILGRFLKLALGNARDPLILELPPLRLPILRNVLMKTQMRLSGFFTHVLPLVVAMNIAVRLLAGEGTSFGGLSIALFSRRSLGIPPEALFAVVLTMFQRYLAPVFLLQLPLTAKEATIAVTMVTLGLPCLPSAVTLWREMGSCTVAFTFLISACLSLGWGMLLNCVLS